MRRALSKALTGPIERGDTETIQKHIQDIKKYLPNLLNLYKITGQNTVDIAKIKGSITDLQKNKLNDILK